MKPIHSFAAALAMTSALTGGALAATKVGVIGAANPQVYVEREDGNRIALKVGDEIFLNDKVSTDGKGSAQLMFLDKSALTISPESAVTIDTFVYDPAAKDGAMTVNGAKGAFRFIGGALTKKKAVNIKTPVSTIGIRGGIVDTHIAAGGQTDAVFLFGKEMTMTNAAGETSSTTQFGSGIGLTDGAALPAVLPQNVVAARIAKSPTQAAVAVAPPAPSAKLDALENKVTLKGADKAAIMTAPEASGNQNGGGGSSSPAAAPKENGAAPAGGDEGSNGSGGNTGSAPATPQGGPNDAGNGGGASAPEAAPEGAPQTSAPAPTQPVLAGGFKEGAGMKPMAMVVDPVAPIAPTAMQPSGAETFYAKMDKAIKSEPSSGTTQTQASKLFNLQRTASSRSGEQPPQFMSDLIAPKTDPEPQQPLQETARIEPTDVPLTSTSDLLEPLTELEETTTVAAPTTQTTTAPPAPPQSIFGQTLPWQTEPALPQATTKKGRFGFRDTMGTDTYSYDDEVEIGHIASFDDGSGDLAGKLVFKATRNEKGVSGYDSIGGGGVTAGDLSNHVIGYVDAPSSGYHSLTANNVYLEDATGSIVISDNFSGGSYATAGGSANYVQLQFDEGGSTNYLRAYLRSSLLDGVDNAADAQGAYNTMLTNSIGYASINGGTGGIIEYDFLPELIVDMSSGGTPEFGRIDYNQLSGFGSGANQHGLFVDYTNKKFLGGYVDFAGSTPTIQALFGKVNSNSVITYDSTNNVVQGLALEGSFYDLNQDSAGFNGYNNEQLDVAARASSLASGTGTNDAIEAMVIETHDGIGTAGSLRSQQAAVIGTGATATLLDNPTQNPTLYGFSAGLISDNANNVSRLKTDNVYDTAIIANTSGTASATIKYYETEAGTGSFNTAQKTIKFGGSSVDNAALQQDLYAAEVNNTGLIRPSGANQTAGAIVSMHEAIDPSQLVCATCEFAHWGVWQADHIDGGGGVIQQTALVPYVAGQVTTGSELGDLATNGTGTVTYNGNAVANIALTDGGGTAIHNSVGTMTANIDLTNRQILSGNMNIEFNNIGGQTQDLAIRNNGVIGFTGSNTFTGDVQTNFTDSTNASSGFTALSGSAGNLNGAFFGSNAEEVGGNFYVQGANGGESAKAGGIYLGKR